MHVVEYSGELVSEMIDKGDVTAICQAVTSDRAAYPLLAGVDEYDDTTFNARQAAVLADELRRLATERPDLVDATARLITLAELLAPAPRRPHHRRLIFNGD